MEKVKYLLKLFGISIPMIVLFQFIVLIIIFLNDVTYESIRYTGLVNSYSDLLFLLLGVIYGLLNIFYIRTLIELVKEDAVYKTCMKYHHDRILSKNGCNGISAFVYEDIFLCPTNKI